MTGGEIPDFDAAMESARESAKDKFAALRLAFDDAGGLVDTTKETP